MSLPKPSSSVPPPLLSYTAPLTQVQVSTLRKDLETQGFSWVEKPYTIFAAEKPKLQIAVYEKGPKILVQGKGTEEFVRFYLEPELLKEAKLGYEEVHSPEMFGEHFGIDESGKGDFFGPLVIAGVYTNGEIARSLRAAGIKDSKKITSDAQIQAFAKIIRETPGIAYDVITISPKKYNELYQKFANLNRLLAWGHARVIENLLNLRPECPRALSDQFANPILIKRALMEKGQKIQMDQRTKAESDPAVAAASILARESFTDWLKKAGMSRPEIGAPLPRGVSKGVKDLARRLVKTQGAQVLEELTKVHFKTAAEVSGLLDLD